MTARDLQHGLPVGWELVPNLQVGPVPGSAPPALRIRGSLMESARVFAGVDVTFDDGRVRVVVRSRLMDDRHPGSPDFDVVVPADLPPGRHPVVYGDASERNLGQVEL